MALRSRVLAAVAVAVPLALAAGCSGGTAPAAQAAQAGPGGGIPAGPAPGPQSLSETGSTLLFPVLRNWAAAYRQQHANVAIATAATGSGKGIAEASAGAVDIGASDAYLSSGDLVTNPAMVNIPLAVSAQQVNYNVPGLRPATHLKLNGKVLAEMYQGSITSWNDPRIAALNPGVALPHTRVVPLHRADSSGDTFLFTSYLSTQDAAWDRVTGYGTTVDWPHVPGARAEIHNTGMVTGRRGPGRLAHRLVQRAAGTGGRQPGRGPCRVRRGRLRAARRTGRQARARVRRRGGSATRRPPTATSGSSGPWITPTSAPCSGWPGPGWRPA